MNDDHITNELASIYLDDSDRFVVALIVGYSNEDMELDFGKPNRLRPEQALGAALDLTRDDGSPDTQRWVYDREKGEGRFIEQADAERFADW